MYRCQADVDGTVPSSQYTMSTLCSRPPVSGYDIEKKDAFLAGYFEVSSGRSVLEYVSDKVLPIVKA